MWHFIQFVLQIWISQQNIINLQNISKGIYFKSNNKADRSGANARKKKWDGI